MRLIIIFMLFSTSVFSQRQVIGIYKNGRPGFTQPMMVILWGESNAGGQAPNASATSDELLPRNLQILNNTTKQFQPLEVGVNNNIGHAGITCCTTHGMEIGLANSYDDGDFLGHPVYLVKAGQGGSLISNWTTPGAYFDTMRVRVQAAYNKILDATGQVPIVEVWGEIGGNDMLASTSPSTFKTAYKQFISDVRAMINLITGQTTIPFLFSRWDYSTPFFQTYETVFGEIDSEVSDCYAISVAAATDTGDDIHWDYAGFLYVVPLFVTIAITYL